MRPATTDNLKICCLIPLYFTMFYYMCNSNMAKFVWNFVHNCQKLKDIHSKFVNFALIRQYCAVLTLPSTKINTAAASNYSSLVKIRFSKSFNKKIRFATLVKSPSTVMAMLHLTGRRTPFSYWAQVICPICSSGITTCE